MVGYLQEGSSEEVNTDLIKPDLVFLLVNSSNI